VKADQPPFGGFRQKRGQPILEDWDHPIAESVHSLCIGLADPDPVAQMCKAGSRHQTHVAGADDRYIH
jgi:hypothetical protein